eukprot:g15641.t1
MKRADTDSRLNLEDHENAEASTDEDDESGSPLDGLKMTINCPRVDHIKMVDNNKIMDINLLEATQSSPATTLSRDSSGRSPGTAPPSDSSGNHQEASSSELAAVLLQEHQGDGYEEEVVKLEDKGSSESAASSSPAPATKKLEPLRLGGGENVNETTLCSSATTSAPTNDMITAAQTTAAQQQAQQMEEIYDIMQLIGEGSSGSVWSARRRILVGTERERLSKQVFAVKEYERTSDGK